MEYTKELAAWEEQFVNCLEENTIEKVTFWQVNPQYFAFDENKVWVLDGGISIETTAGKTITFGWNKEMELMDLKLAPAKVLLGELDFYALEDVSEKVNAAIQNKTIKAVDFEWNWYQTLDENFELNEELNYAPLGISLQFEDDQTLQLSSIKFALEGQNLANATYLPEGDLLVALNEQIPVVLEEVPEE